MKGGVLGNSLLAAIFLGVIGSKMEREDRARYIL